ncbi:MAG: integration host factor subunit beta [Candidatus Omnitrophica bacterium]|nr:integration host factor subunit beta [Candidatus Omnitrophota bacterium]MBU1933008.1 integration host factor subunit beta [Candidatus Omnitrophota bacterium]
MTKKDIVVKLAGESGIKQIDVKKVVQMTFDIIVDALAKGEKIELRNFGVFKTKSRKGRMGRNPRTGQQVPVEPKRVAIFKPGMVMKAKVK